MYNATIIRVHAYTYVRDHACACACVTIVVHTGMYAVIGVLRNMKVFNYLGSLKYMHNATMCVHAYAYVREHACVRVRNRSCTD